MLHFEHLQLGSDSLRLASLAYGLLGPTELADCALSSASVARKHGRRSCLFGLWRAWRDALSYLPYGRALRDALCTTYPPVEHCETRSV